MARHLEAQWFHGVDGLEQLRSDWLRLTQGAQIFERYEWHWAAAMHLAGGGWDISFCRIGDASGMPHAIVPVVPACATVGLFGELPALTLGRDTQLAAFDFPLSRTAEPVMVGRAMLGAFREHHAAWEVISWPRVMARGNAARIAMAIRPWLTDISPASPCNTFYTGSNSDPASGCVLFQAPSGKWQKKLAQRIRRLAGYGPVQLRMASDEGDLEGFFQEFLRIEASGWKGEKGTRTAIALVPSVHAFYNALVAASNRDFEVDVALLYAGDRAVAGQFLVRTAGWQHIYKIGYDEEFSNCSPGQILQQLILDRAKANDAVDRVSLVTGLDWHKDWGPIAEPTLRIGIHRNVFRAQSIKIGRSVLGQYKKLRDRLKRGAEAPPGAALNPQRPAA